MSCGELCSFLGKTSYLFSNKALGQKWNEAEGAWEIHGSEMSQWITYSIYRQIHSLLFSCSLSSLTHAHSPSHAKSRFCHEHPSHPPSLSPREREKVKEWLPDSWLCKAEHTPHEYIIMLIKVTVCFGYGRLLCCIGSASLQVIDVWKLCCCGGVIV